LWQGWEDPSGMVMWDDKDGNRIEPDVYLILPKKIDELYVYWNELIKLTKFYFNNKDSQDDEINNIYFEIIANVEKLLNGNGCGGLKEIYKKPFRNMIGCEFEIKKQGLNTDGLFVNLYDFLGRITELSLPDKNNVEKIKKDNSAFFTKIKQYTEQHLAKRKTIQESPTTKIEIIKMPELRIKKKAEKLSGNNKKTNEINYQTSFNEDKSVLSICNKNIKIRKFSDQYHLLRIVFEDELKDWQFSEIAELIDSEKAFKWKNLYNSANEIKKKIAIETGIKDFFITTTQSIKINEKYLKKS